MTFVTSVSDECRDNETNLEKDKRIEKWRNKSSERKTPKNRDNEKKKKNMKT